MLKKLFTTKKTMTNRLFPTEKLMDERLKIDKDSEFYISHPEVSTKICDLIENEVGSDIIITDMTACVGGDTIRFALRFKGVNAIERNKVRYQYLCNNIDCYHINNVYNIFNRDCMDVYSELKHDVVYFDPPWGGPEYKNHDNIRLELSGRHIEDCVKEILQSDNSPRLVVLKLPKNYDNNAIYDNLSDYTIRFNELRRMNIVFIY